MSSATPHLPATASTFVQLLPHSRHGARLARRAAVARLRSWPVPPVIIDQAEQIVAELAANAALHGQVRGRSFRLTLALDFAACTLRIEVTDARGESPPVPRPAPNSEDESGRGLLIVVTLADRWGVDLTVPPLKTVWAELDLGRG